MRLLILFSAALAASACQDRASPPASGCARVAAHEVAWTSEAAPDVVTARSDGPTCAQAVVTLVGRNDRGDPLWAFASTYYEMKSGASAPEDAPAVSEDEMDQFLTDWANVTVMRSGDLPQWREGAATLSESAETFSYETPFDREVYEMLRERNGPMICFAAGAEAVQCLIVDPATNTPAMMVAYGP